MSEPTATATPRASRDRILTLVSWLAVFAWAGVIFRFSSLPATQVPHGNPVLAHFVEYALFGALLCLALSRSMAPRDALWAAVLIASAYAVTDELHQHFVPGRTPDVGDWSIDTLGAIAGATAVMALALWARRRRRA
jgi:MYXO-CTERM domain-containing protein